MNTKTLHQNIISPVNSTNILYYFIIYYSFSIPNDDLLQDALIALKRRRSLRLPEFAGILFKNAPDTYGFGKIQLNPTTYFADMLGCEISYSEAMQAEK